MEGKQYETSSRLTTYSDENRRSQKKYFYTIAIHEFSGSRKETGCSYCGNVVYDKVESKKVKLENKRKI